MTRFSRTFRQCLAGSALAGAATLGVGQADAATDTANLVVEAEVTANCSISTTGLNFGQYDPVGTHASTDLDGTGTIQVTCTSGSTGAITLSQGANADPGSTDDVPLRRMTDGAEFLGYFLYQDSGRTTVWGNSATTDVDHLGTGTSTDVTVYGRVTAGQNVAAGSYSDTVVATITF